MSTPVFYTSNNYNKPAILPEAVEQLVTLPVQAASIAFQVGTLVATSNIEVRIPLVTADPSAAWTPEGGEITPTNPTVDSMVITPKKIAGLTIVSNEMAADSNPAAQGIIGKGLANDIAKKVDAAFFGNTVADGPSGLQSITPTVIDGLTAWSNMDPFAEAISDQEALGVTPTAFVANPADALILAKLKESTSSNKPLLQPDPTNATRRQLQGVPLKVSPAIEVGVIWLIPAERVVIVRRTDVELEVDRSVYFTSDRLAVRATMRIGWGVTQEAAVVRLALADESASSS